MIENLGENETLEKDLSNYLIKNSKCLDIITLNKNNIDTIVFKHIDDLNFIIKKSIEKKINVQSKKNYILKEETLKLFERFNEKNLKVIHLKGTTLYEDLYDNIGKREINDIDILIERKDLKEVYSVLEDLGYISKKLIIN